MTDYSLLFQVPIDELASPNPILLDHTLPVGDTLKRFAQEHILSAPVQHVETDMILGSVDILDLLTFVLSCIKYSDYVDLAAVKEKMREPVHRAMGASRVNPFLPVLDAMTLEDIIVTLFSKGVHRVPIVDEDEAIVGICSQSDVVDYVHQNLRFDVALVALGNKTLSQLDIKYGHMVSATDTMTMLDAFKLLIANTINAIPVVDGQGKLIANLSAADFEGVTEENFVELAKPLSSFLPPQGSRPVLFLKRSSTFEDAINLFNVYKVHRVYIVDGNHTPIGVLTLTDILKIMVDELHLTAK